ncbi:MAG: LptE family protein [Bacteroidota bacterium]
MNIRSGPKVMVVMVATCLALVGCAGYRVGTLLPERYKTISVPMFKNGTNQPNIEPLATNAVIEQLNVDRTLRVIDQDADLLLNCTIVRYVRTAIRYAEGTRPQEYRLTITVSATLSDVREQKEVWSRRPISGNYEFQAGGDLYSSERVALPMVMEDLAHDIVEAIVEGW